MSIEVISRPFCSLCNEEGKQLYLATVDWLFGVQEIGGFAAAPLVTSHGWTHNQRPRILRSYMPVTALIAPMPH